MQNTTKGWMTVVVILVLFGLLIVGTGIYTFLSQYHDNPVAMLAAGISIAFGSTALVGIAGMSAHQKSS